MKSGHANNHLTRVIMSEKALIAHVLHAGVREFYTTPIHLIVDEYLAKATLGPDGTLTLGPDRPLCTQGEIEATTVLNETDGITLLEVVEIPKEKSATGDQVTTRAQAHAGHTDGGIGNAAEQKAGTTRMDGIDTVLVTPDRERRTDLAIRIYTPYRYCIRITFEFDLDMKSAAWEAGRASYGVARLMQSEEERAFAQNHFEMVEPCYCICVCLNPSRKDLYNTIAATVPDVDIRHGKPSWNMGSLTQNRVTMICLGGPDHPEGGPYEGVVKLLHTVLTDTIPFDEKKGILKDEFGLAVEPDLEKEMRNMTKWEEDIVERTQKKMMEKQAASLNHYMKKFGKSLAVAMDDWGMPLSDMGKYQELIDQMKTGGMSPA